jgi:hypothetical protein
MVTADEQTATQRANAEADARFWDSIARMNADTGEDHKALIATAERTAARNEAKRANAAEHAAKARERIARIERGENVEGGLGKPMTPEDWVRILRAAGMTASDITPELAKLVPGNLERGSHRLGMERTDWGEHYGKPKAVRTVLIDAESTAEWQFSTNVCRVVLTSAARAPRRRVFFDEHSDSLELWSPGSPSFPMPEVEAMQQELAGISISTLLKPLGS